MKEKLAEKKENTEKVLKINSWSLFRTIFVNRWLSWVRAWLVIFISFSFSYFSIYSLFHAIFPGTHFTILLLLKMVKSKRSFVACWTTSNPNHLCRNSLFSLQNVVANGEILIFCSEFNRFISFYGNRNTSRYDMKEMWECF